MSNYCNITQQFIIAGRSAKCLEPVTYLAAIRVVFVKIKTLAKLYVQQIATEQKVTSTLLESPGILKLTIRPILNGTPVIPKISTGPQSCPVLCKVVSICGEMSRFFEKTRAGELASKTTGRAAST